MKVRISISADCTLSGAKEVEGARRQRGVRLNKRTCPNSRPLPKALSLKKSGDTIATAIKSDEESESSKFHRLLSLALCLLSRGCLSSRRRTRGAAAAH